MLLAVAPWDMCSVFPGNPGAWGPRATHQASSSPADAERRCYEGHHGENAPLQGSDCPGGWWTHKKWSRGPRQAQGGGWELLGRVAGTEVPVVWRGGPPTGVQAGRSGVGGSGFHSQGGRLGHLVISGNDRI